MYSGVPPSSIALLMSAPASISARTTALWPFSAATSSGVWPSFIVLLMAAPASNSARTTASLPS